MTEYDKFKEELDALKSQVDDLNKQISERSTGNNGSGSGNSGGNSTSSNESWTVLYDMNSEDPEINLGYTQGIGGSLGRLESLPDLSPYNTLRIKFYALNSNQYHYFDISEPLTNGCRLLTCNLTTTIIVGANFSIGFKDNIQYLFVGNFTTLTFTTNKYPTITDVGNNKSYYVSKIEVKTSAM